MKISNAILTLGLGAMIAAAQPTFSKQATAVNAASRIPRGLPGYGVAPGSRFVLIGKQLGPTQEAKGDSVATRVTISIGGATYDATVVSARADRVDAQLPADIPVGSGRAIVEYQGAKADVPIEIVPVAFGIYSKDAGMAVARHTGPQTDVTPQAAARPGEDVTIVGTGAGAGDQPFEVLLGGRSVGEVGFSRLDQGIDELTFRVPANVPIACAVPVVVKIGATYSNFATMPVSRDGGACPAENGLTASDLDRIQQSGGARLGTISLSRQNIEIEEIAMTADAGSGSFRRTTAAAGSVLTAMGWAIPRGQCLVFTASEGGEEWSDFATDQPLDAGPALELSGPRGARRLKKERDHYSGDLGQSFALPPGFPSQPGMPNELYLEPGSYTLAGPGGADVGAFTANFRVSPAITWSNRAEVSVLDRTKDLRINWQGGAADDLVTVFGGSSAGMSSASFVCVERAAAGGLTVPAAVVSRLPASGEGMLSLQAGPVGEGTRFTAPGLDFGWISATSGATRTIAVR